MLIDNGHFYTLPVGTIDLNFVTGGTRLDVFYIQAGTTAGSRSSVGIVGFELMQEVSETSEQLVVELFRTSSSAPATAAQITPVKAMPGDPDARFTAYMGQLAENTVSNLWKRISANALSGWSWEAKHAKDILWIVGDTTTAQNARAAIGFETAPASALLISGWVDVVELRW